MKILIVFLLFYVNSFSFYTPDFKAFEIFKRNTKILKFYESYVGEQTIEETLKNIELSEMVYFNEKMEKIKVDYFFKNNLTESILYNAEGIPLFEGEKKFDNNNRIIESILESDGVITNKVIYSYLDNSYSIEYYSIYDGILQLCYMQEVKYANNLVSDQIWRFYDANHMVSSKEQFFYDSKNRLIKTKFQFLEDNNSVINLINYDNNNRIDVVIQDIYNKFNTKIHTIKKNYTYISLDKNSDYIVEYIDNKADRVFKQEFLDK